MAEQEEIAETKRRRLEAFGRAANPASFLIVTSAAHWPQPKP